ncbi:hypothetical protein Ae201684P_000408 [Aphanomyces euteiches]|uniref:Uncharacterized protein n=1 Tax=Aphanomyces euteiches TaxID=100861 RepID=A0A6G0XRR9_9STRA|nr:hypothetical protein Ae201684_002100 [Aphanomyces euteiches]KAH9086993.1 hypothetical protein Ae201684P_000408 [Aphanomyces euteiches]
MNKTLACSFLVERGRRWSIESKKVESDPLIMTDAIWWLSRRIQHKQRCSFAIKRFLVKRLMDDALDTACDDSAQRKPCHDGRMQAMEAMKSLLDGSSLCHATGDEMASN